MQHLDDNAASEFVSGTLSPSALARAETHLASCRECRTLVAALAGDPSNDSAAATAQRAPAHVASEPLRRPPTSGDRVGRYLVLSALGAGGMGVVFAAWDPQLGRKIALKLLRSSPAMSTRDARSRLRREAQAIAQLSHPNVVSIYDVGATEDGALYIAMEFVEGDTLTSWLRSYPRTWREILDVFRQAARGLIAAHGVGLLHRDFKPDNVLVGGDGRVRVTDFGLARSVLLPEEVSQVKPVGPTALDVALTATGTVLGTPRYMPPEQLTGPELDARSDQFSFCVALYEALYGRHPLPGGTSVAMLDHGERALAPPVGSKVPAAIGRTVLRGLERDRARRFPSMGALIDELEIRPRRSPLRYAGLVTAATLLIGGTTAAVVAQQRAPSERPTDFTTLDGLVADRDRQEAEIQRLSVALGRANARIVELESERATSADKDAEIARLGGVVTQLQTALQAARARLARVGPAPALASDPLDPAVVAIRGCFVEWDDRNGDARDVGADATIVAVVTVTPDGRGTMPRIVRTPDDHPPVPGSDTPGMSLLEMCVADQVGRLKFPRSSEELEVEETIRWSAGKLALAPKIIGHHQVPLRRIELP